MGCYNVLVVEIKEKIKKNIFLIIVTFLAGVVTVLFIFFLQNPDYLTRPNGLSNFELGQYYFNHDEDPAGPYDLEKARFYYEKAIVEDSLQNDLLWYQLGRIDFLEGKFDNALEKFDTQLEYFPGPSQNVYYMIALTHGYKARREGVEVSWVMAEETFKKVMNGSPDSPWPRVDLAWVYFSQGKYEEMLPVLEVGLERNSGNPWLLNMYGLAVMNTTTDKQSALNYFKQAKVEAAKLSPEDWGRTYPGNDKSNWEAGLKEFRETIDKNIALLE